MFIALDNGQYVRDPVFHADNWFIRFDDGLTTIAVRTYRTPSEEGLRKRVRKILRESFIPAKIRDTESNRTQSVFPPGFNGLKECAVLELEVLPLPFPADLPCEASIYTSSKPNEEVLNGRVESC
jgi:hypothetical protein